MKPKVTCILTLMEMCLKEEIINKHFKSSVNFLFQTSMLSDLLQSLVHRKQWTPFGRFPYTADV